MNIVWTLHAEEQLRAIAFAIAEDRSREDAVNWVQQLREQVASIADFPGIGHVPREPWLDTFREIDFKGYRIFYQVEKARSPAKAVVISVFAFIFASSFRS